jgi:hypothetical protein
MRKSILIFSLLLLVPAFASRASAQEQPKPAEAAKAAESQAHYYHLEFVVQEIGADGKPTNSRAYTTVVSTNERREAAHIRTGSRIPIVTGSVASPDSPNAAVNTQFQYVDVGVNIDAQHTQEVGRQLSFDVTAEISSLADTHGAILHQPIIRQNRWQAVVLIPIGKPTVAFTSDALDSKGSMQLVVTATPLQ